MKKETNIWEDYELKSLEELFQYILGSYYNGQLSQVSHVCEDLTREQTAQFIKWTWLKEDDQTEAVDFCSAKALNRLAKPITVDEAKAALREAGVQSDGLWTVDAIKEMAEQWNGVKLTDEEAREVLHDCELYFTEKSGINRDLVTSLVEPLEEVDRSGRIYTFEEQDEDEKIYSFTVTDPTRPNVADLELTGTIQRENFSRTNPKGGEDSIELDADSCSIEDMYWHGEDGPRYINNMLERWLKTEGK